MSDLYEEYGLELEKEASIPPSYMPSAYNNQNDKNSGKKKTNWLFTIIALFMGLFMGVAGVFGGFFLALNTPARPAIEFVGGFAGINYDEKIKNKLLAEEYEGKTFLQIGMELLAAAEKKNLAGIDKVSPIVGDYLDKMVQNMNKSFGVKMDTEILLNTEVTELPSYLGETFRTTPLGNMLKATSNKEELEPILMEICYGEEGVHYVLDENGEVVMLGDNQPATFETFGGDTYSMINRISLAAVVPPTPTDTVMLSLAYGRDGVTYELATDGSGNYLYDSNGHVIVNMLPMYYTVDGDKVYDYNGDLVNCTLETAENGYLKMTKAPSFEGAAEEIYYLKNDGTGKYFAYKAPEEGAEAVLFKKTMIGDMSKDSMAIINNIYLKDALNVKYGTDPANDPHPIFFSLAYGQEGVDYTVDPVTREITMLDGAQPNTIGDLRERGTDLIHDISLSDIMSADPSDKISMYLIYGKENVHYQVETDGTITMLQRRIALLELDGVMHVFNEYGESISGTVDTVAQTYVDDNGVTYKYLTPSPALVPPTVTTDIGRGTTENEADDYATIYYLTDLEDNPLYYEEATLAALTGSDQRISNMTKRMTIGEVLGEEDVMQNKFLKHVDDCTINDLPNAILDLSVTQIFHTDIYYADPTKGIFQNLNDTPMIDIHGQKIFKGDYYKKLSEDSYEYYEPTADDLRATWWYLLNDPTDPSDPNHKNPEDYKVAEDMNALLSNMTANVHNATLQKLADDKIVELDDAMLSTKIVKKIEGVEIPGLEFAEGKTYLGELTTTEMLKYTSIVMGKIPGATP